MLDHQKLDVYQVSVAFVASAARCSSLLPRGHADLLDQLKRSAFSIPLNIAEGIGKPTTAERRRYLAIARGSAMESSATLDVLVACGLVEAAEVAAAQAQLERIVAMLSKMCR